MDTSSPSAPAASPPPGEDMTLLGIHETQGINGGYPCVGNTRIPVRVLVEDYQANGSIAAVAALYPDLSIAQITGALLFYRLYPKRVDEDINRNIHAFDTARMR